MNLVQNALDALEGREDGRIRVRAAAVGGTTTVIDYVTAYRGEDWLDLTLLPGGHDTVIDRDTGEILRELTINPNKDNQPLGLPPGPKKGTPRQGGMPKGYKFPQK